MKKLMICTAMLFGLSLWAQAQTFSSGSTGADGALDLTSGDRQVQLPDSGILNYTTVNIPSGRTLTFKSPLKNPPVIMLAQGAVVITGTINISANFSGTSVPGPGGFYGATYVSGTGIYLPGFGPGAGQPPPADTNARWVGPLSLVPNIGGSGGAVTSGQGNGGNGGGAITIASSGSVQMSGGIFACGNSLTGNNTCSVFISNYGTGPTADNGASGAIRIVANSISVTGGFQAAIVRLEGPVGSVTYAGYYGTAPVISPINPTIIPTVIPSLSIVSIGGFAVPSYSGGSFNTIDLILPNAISDPIPVFVQASNIPVGSPVTVTFSGSGGGAGTSTTGTLAGTLASSTATLTVSGLTRSAVTYLFLSSTFAVTGSSAEPAGKDTVASVRLESAPGVQPKFAFLRKDGTEVAPAKVSASLRQQLGQ